MTGGRESWHIEDSRTPHLWCGISGFFSKEHAEMAIEGYKARDARGGRPDIHELVPFLIAVRSDPDYPWGRVNESNKHSEVS